MKQLLIVFALISFGIASAQSTATFFKEANDVFSTYVIGDKINYSAIAEDPKELNEAIDAAKSVSVSTSNPKTYQAFWINAYNLLTIKGIVDNYPVNSPMDISGFFDTITYNVGGQNVTLNQIENDLLRAKFPNEPRFHFVLVCAAQSCPPIVNYAYSPNYLDGQLEEQTTKALNNPTFLKVSGNSVQFSKIMDWYNEDFTRNGQTLIEFTNKYRRDKLPADAKTSFYEYNWSLNETKKKITKVSAVPDAKPSSEEKKEEVAMKKNTTENATTVSTSSPKNNAVDSESATKPEAPKEVVVTAVPQNPETPEPEKKPSTITYDNVGNNPDIELAEPNSATTNESSLSISEMLENKAPNKAIVVNEQDQSNIQKYTPSKLIGKGEYDIKFFNNLYTQTQSADENGDVTSNEPRQTFLTTTLEVYTGIGNNKRVNLGGILRFRSNTVGGRDVLDVFKFDGESNTARSGLTAIAPSIKFTPFANVGNFSIQSSFFIPLIDNETENGVFLEQDSFVWQNRFFYDYTFSGDKFQLFTELNLEYQFGDELVQDASFQNSLEGSFANNSLVVAPGLFLSYFPTTNFTVLGLVQHFQRLDLGNEFTQDFTAIGGGAKYQLTDELNVEALYTNFIRGNSTGLGQTFNLGLRAIF